MAGRSAMPTENTQHTWGSTSARREPSGLRHQLRGPCWQAGAQRTRKRSSTHCFASCPDDALAVVDQRRNIGALAIRRSHAADKPVAYLPGSIEHCARRRQDNIGPDRAGAERPQGMRKRTTFPTARILPGLRGRMRDGREMVRGHARRARRPLEHTR